MEGPSSQIGKAAATSFQASQSISDNDLILDGGLFWTSNPRWFLTPVEILLEWDNKLTN